ncbi:MAG: hypothetical protein M1814_001332 [Vezdaea aestivalis]|nr:MAG: hypothetical protein M1814_001332 [Vezdaea aestivalis]
MAGFMMDGSQMPTNNGQVFMDPNNPMDPSMGFMPNQTAGYDLSAFSQAGLQPQMNNPAVRNPSPAFQNPSYQVTSAIPSKRPLPRGDSLGASPHQSSMALPNSRSETPQQGGFSGFQPNQHQQQQQPFQHGYQHLQAGGSANASPSPVMQNQQFRGAANNPRVQTASPSPFSSASQGFAPQMSPAQQDPTVRMSTPQGNPSTFMQGMQFQHGFNPNFNAAAAGGPTPPGSMMSQQQMMFMQQGQNPQQQPQPMEMNRHNQMRLAHYRQQMLAVQPGNATPQSMQHMNAAGQMPVANAAMKTSPNRGQQPVPRNNNPEQFLRTVAQFMNKQGQRFEPNPIVCGRRIPLASLYAAVMRKKGSKKVTQDNLWPVVAAELQLAQAPTAGIELKEAYERNLGAYEEAWMQSQAGNIRAANSMSQGQAAEIVAQNQQGSPNRQINQNTPGHNLQGFPAPGAAPHPQQPNIKGQPPGNFKGNNMNGFTAQQQTPHQRQPSLINDSPSVVRPTGDKGTSMSVGIPQQPAFDTTIAVNPAPIPPSTNYVPKTRALDPDVHGGLNTKTLSIIGAEIANLRPSHPHWNEMGVVDIHSIIMSLQSGVNKDVRWALDSLMGLTSEVRIVNGIQLNRCDGLVDSLLDCAEEQMDFLVDHSTEAGVDIQLPNYEEMIRNAKNEAFILQDVPGVYTDAYRLDRAVERLICVTTILRNLSFSQQNHPFLTDGTVVKFLATLIRHIGTRNSLLCTNGNLLELSKDILVFLSNVALAIELPSKDEGAPILLFILVFAPSSPPPKAGQPILFPPYQPTSNTYLSTAVDSLAKLLARDEPNRSILRSLLLADGSPYELLTRTFALAIAPAAMPGGALRDAQCAEIRKPFLSQGMLAADILSTMIPANESALARAWLTSEDGFARVLLRLVSSLGMERTAAPRMQGMSREEQDGQSFASITQRGLAVLRRLAEKAKDQDDPDVKLPVGILPKKETILGALLAHTIDGNLVRQLVSYADVDS